MNKVVNVGLVSHERARLSDLETAFAKAEGVVCSPILLKETSGYPENDALTNIDVLLISVGENWKIVVDAVQKRTDDEGPAIVFTGPINGAELIRLAFKAGAHDYIDESLDGPTLIQAVHQAVNTRRQSIDKGNGYMTLFVAPQGGAGTTTLAVNLAHILSARTEQPNVLAMDMDIQYGNLPLSFDEKPNTRLAGAIANGETIDDSIIDACLCRKSFSPKVLATYSDDLVSPWDINPQQIDTLFTLLTKRFDHVIVDMPRSIDPLTFHALERADRICVVVQQTISDLRVASHYIRLLKDQEIASDKICLVINRHESRNIIRNQDFVTAFGSHEIFVVPNDFKRVSSAADHTTPIIARFKNALISKSLIKLSQQLWVTDTENSRWSFGGRGKTNKVA